MSRLFRKTSMTISAELHRSIERTCTPIIDDPGEVVGLRSAENDPDHRVLTRRPRSEKLPSPRRLDGNKRVKFAAGF
jgi:hypothetical protein